MNDFKDTLFKALDVLGCAPGRFSFDAQSPIVMSFSDVEDVVLEPAFESVNIWGMLPDFGELAAVHGVQQLLTELATPVAFLATGGYMLRAGEAQRIHLGGALSDECMADSQLLASAIEAFHTHLAQIREAVR